MIASHYAEPAARAIGVATTLREAPADHGAPIADLAAGERFALLDESLGWSWGYAGKDRRVGYVRSEALAASAHY